MKKYLLGVLAIVLAIGVSSYTVKRSSVTLRFVPSEVTWENIIDEASYDQVTPSDCSGFSVVPCEFETPAGLNLDDESELINYIETEFANDHAAGVEFIKSGQGQYTGYKDL